MTSTDRRTGALKGSAAAVAGVAVLLGGAGTFALWNADLGVGTTDTETGELSATFSSSIAWEDTTTGKANDITDISTFRLVPGDTLEGTTSVDVVAEGENLYVEPELVWGGASTLPAGVTADLTLTDGGVPVTEIEGTNDGATQTFEVLIDLRFDESATASMNESIALSDASVVLKQVYPAP